MAAGAEGDIREASEPQDAAVTIDFSAAFAALTTPPNNSSRSQTAEQSARRPFRWQQRLFDEFARGAVPDACDIPTGLGKTSVMAIWLAALDLTGAERPLPRRLVYVVDRRAVVDQATEEAETLARNIGDGTKAEISPVIARLRRRLGLQRGQTLPVSTLRGQLADNRAWLDDPSAPAIVVGTVDMIGSRLLFQGYGVSPKMRPVHAALLGSDALIVLDEAHLVPPFQSLIEQVSALTRQDCERVAKNSGTTSFKIPPMRTMALSATGRTTRGRTFALEPADVGEDTVVRQRVDAPKWIKLENASTGNLAEAMAARALAVAADRYRVVVFCNSRKIAQEVFIKLERSLGKQARLGENIGLIVGARRVREREELAESSVFRRFAHVAVKAGEPGRAGAAFLVATSAGEVGIDIDAEHMICDLVAWERMVQRLGRVNRRGECPESLIDVFVATPDKEAEISSDTPTIEACLQPFESPTWVPRSDGRRNASPGMLRRLRDDPEFKALCEQATTGEPLRPAVTRALVDAWSMTSLETHTGRPDVAPWIRGWIDEETPQTEVLWRRSMPIREGDDDNVTVRELAAFFEMAPPHLSEILETEAYRVVELLRARGKALSKRSRVAANQPESAQGADDGEDGAAEEGARAEEEAKAETSALPPLAGHTVVAVVLERDGSIALLRLDDILNRDGKRLHATIENRRLVLDARLGGLATSGLLDPKEHDAPATLDGPRIAKIADERDRSLWSDERLSASGLGFRVRIAQYDADEADWRVAYRRFVDAASDDADDLSARLEWRVEEWVGDGAAENETSLAGTEQMLAEHHACIATWADQIADALMLPQALHDMLVTAARYHDCGKARTIWQRYAGNPGFARGKKPPIAKFTRRGDPGLLKVGDGTYRHEFGSLHDVLKDGAFEHFLPVLRPLGLRLIAAHHGHARPAIFAYDEKHPGGDESHELAARIVQEFAMLQAQWGAWGLAWWEALLRAADVAASREAPGQEVH